MRTPPPPDTAPRDAPAPAAPAEHSEPPTEGPAADLVARLRGAVGSAHVLLDPDVVAGYTTDWTGRFSGRAALVVRPGSTAEVASVLEACSAGRIPVVVQGGNTGLVGSSVPPPAGGAHAAGAARPLQAAPVVLSTARLSAIGVVDAVAGQVTAGAGATLDLSGSFRGTRSSTSRSGRDRGASEGGACRAGSESPGGRRRRRARGAG